MTPKEKAKQLIESIMPYVYIDKTIGEYFNAKQCALIAVDEILFWFKHHSYTNKNYDAFVFYNEVKQEIKKI